MISAIILAAGQSRRMGRPKMALAWGETTVLGNVIGVLRRAGAEDVVVVSGADRSAVEAIVAECQARAVFNPSYARGEMLSSLQAGLREMSPAAEAALIALGDQPQIQEATVRALIDEYSRASAPLIVPSYQMRRGHPWLVSRTLWADILNMAEHETPRDFLQRHAGAILHVEVDTPTILADLDTPEDYLKSNS